MTPCINKLILFKVFKRKPHSMINALPSMSVVLLKLLRFTLLLIDGPGSLDIVNNRHRKLSRNLYE